MIKITTDLRSMLLPVRDQGHRNSCLSFASSAAHEGRIAAKDELSTEYLFYQAVAQSSPPDPSKGTTFQAVATALKQEGQPEESAWPYTMTPPANWKPPSISTVVYKAELCCGKMSFQEIAASLDASHPIILGLVITSFFYRPGPNGVIPDVDGDLERGGHAVLAVGHGTIDSRPAVLVRNSWGLGWGNLGHGWLSSQYLDLHLHETGYVQ